jgi:hypothetical protein
VSNFAAGNGGEVLLGNGGTDFGPSFIQVTGSINTNGGASTGTTAGTGGRAGDVIIAPRTDLTGRPETQVIIKGSVSAQGGATSNGTVASGDGGVVNIGGSTVQVFGAAAGGGSINTSPGAGGMAGMSTAGIVTVTTASVQPLTSDWNLISTIKSQFALPGGDFDFNSAAANGVSAGIVAGTNKVLPTHTHILYQQFDQAAGAGGGDIHVKNDIGADTRTTPVTVTINGGQMLDSHHSTQRPTSAIWRRRLRR